MSMAKCQQVVLLLLSLELCIHHSSVLAAPSSYVSTGFGTDLDHEEGSTTLKIMAVVPTTFGKDQPQWTKGEEILPGAHLAIKEINSIPDLLSDYRLEVIPFRIPQCDLNRGIAPFLKELTANENIIEIVGYFCHNTAQYFSHLVQHRQVSTLQISASSLDIRDKISLPHQQHSILPLSESIARATAQLMQRLEWRKVCSPEQPKHEFQECKEFIPQDS